MNSDCKVRLYYFEIYYNLILNIAKILSLDNEKKLTQFFNTLRQKAQNFSVYEFNEFSALSFENQNKMQSNYLNAKKLELELQSVTNGFSKILAEPTEPTKLKRLQDAAIFVCDLKTMVKENKISTDA